MSVRREIEHGGWVWDVGSGFRAHPGLIVPEVAWADEHRVTGLADGIRDEVAYDSQHGSVGRIHAPEATGRMYRSP